MDIITFLIMVNIWLTIGAIVAGLIHDPEGATDYLCFLLVWPYALLSGVTNAIWKKFVLR